MLGNFQGGPTTSHVVGASDLREGKSLGSCWVLNVVHCQQAVTLPHILKYVTMCAGDLLGLTSSHHGSGMQSVDRLAYCTYQIGSPFHTVSPIHEYLLCGRLEARTLCAQDSEVQHYHVIQAAW